MKVHVPRGTSAAVYLNITASGHLTPEEYAVVRVVESDCGRVVGGLSVVVVEGEQKKGGGQ